MLFPFDRLVEVMGRITVRHKTAIGTNCRKEERMARRTGFVAVATFLGLLLLASSAGAHVSTAPTTLTIKKAPQQPVDPGDKVIVFGKLKSPDASCRPGKEIDLFRKKPGTDRLLATDRTDAEGEYRFRVRPNRTIKVYTRFDGSVDSTYGHSHTCTGDRSRTIKIKVED